MAITVSTGRRVIQIAVSSGNESEDSYLVALCDDGSMWRLMYRVNSEWEKIDAVPLTVN